MAEARVQKTLALGWGNRTVRTEKKWIVSTVGTQDWGV
jgi:hypothetical protein